MKELFEAVKDLMRDWRHLGFEFWFWLILTSLLTIVGLIGCIIVFYLGFILGL